MNDFKYDKLPAIIGVGGVLLSVIIFIVSARTDSRALAVAGLIVFVLAIVAAKITEKAVAAAVKEKYTRGLSGGSVKTSSKYHLLLIDERTKQDPDVQRLLQYLSVQKAFFDPGYIDSAAARNDPYVQELTEVFDRMLQSSGDMNGDFGVYGNVNSGSAYDTKFNKRELERQDRERKRPRRIAGNILVGLGVGLFVLPFIVIFFFPNGGFPVYMSSLFVTAPSVGMVLAIVGSILKK